MRFLFIILSSLVLFSCNETSKEHSTTVVATSSTAPTNTTDTVSLADIPVFGDFADLEYIFNQKTDSTYIINFWATWCKPCVEELPYFEELHTTYANKKMRVILVSLDFPKQLKSHLVPFINKHQLKSDVKVLTDDRYNVWLDKVDKEWNGSIPISVIYNQKNREFIGRAFENSEELSRKVAEFL